jgi:hypothetical protein
MAEKEQFKDYAKAAEYLEKAHAMDPMCERYVHELYRLYFVELPNPERARHYEALYSDEEKKKARKAEMERRQHVRADLTDGCTR